MDILITLLTGAAAGWLGSVLYKGDDLGLLGNIIIGILGSIVGEWVLEKAGITLGTGVLGTILTGAAGAVIILFLVNLVAKK